MMTMGTCEMLSHAGNSPGINQQCANGHNIFVRGCIPVAGKEDKYVHVDLEQDKIEFAAQDIKISIDIDSVIWTVEVQAWTSLR